VPRALELLSALAERGQNLGAATAHLLRLLDLYGATELDLAIQEATGRGVPHPNAVRQCLERRRHDEGLPLPVAIPLRPGSRLAHIEARTHDLKGYDRLIAAAPETSEEAP
jgi:hypothetical protein